MASTMSPSGAPTAVAADTAVMVDHLLYVTWGIVGLSVSSFCPACHSTTCAVACLTPLHRTVPRWMLQATARSTNLRTGAEKQLLRQEEEQQLQLVSNLAQTAVLSVQ